MAAFTRKILIALALGLSLAWPATASAAASDIQLDALPHYTRDFTGDNLQPISFIYVGTEQEIVELYRSRGWYGADPATPSNLYRAYQASLANAPYPTAPFSPAFIGFDKHDLAFQLPTAENTIHIRHHTRLWATNVTTASGRPVWVGTASFDTGIGTIGRTAIPIHHIDPNIDAERQFIVDSLGAPTEYVQFVPAHSGTNLLGDGFYTDGLAAVIDVPISAQPAPVEPIVYSTPTAQPVASTSGGTLDRFSNWLSRTADRMGLPSDLF